MDPRLRKQYELTDQIRLDTLGWLEASPGYVGNERRHDFWELMYIGAGHGVVTFDGGTEPVGFGKYDIVLVQPGEPHRVSLRGTEDLEMLYVGFSMRFDPGFRFAERIPRILFPHARPHIVKDMLAHVLEHMKAERMDSVAAVCSILYSLAVIIQSIAGDDPTQGERVEAVEKAKAYLEQNIHRPVSVREMAGHVNLCERYCSTLFRESVGVTPKQYHTSLRMTMAAELLKDRDDPHNVSEIADIMGFSSVHHFSRKFKQYFGRSPTAFREAERDQ